MSQEQTQASQPLMLSPAAITLILQAISTVKMAVDLMGNGSAPFMTFLIPTDDGGALQMKASAFGVYLPPQMDPETGNMVELFVQRPALEQMLSEWNESQQKAAKKKPARKKAARKKPAAKKKAATRKAPAKKKAAAKS